MLLLCTLGYDHLTQGDTHDYIHVDADIKECSAEIVHTVLNITDCMTGKFMLLIDLGLLKIPTEYSFNALHGTMRIGMVAFPNKLRTTIVALSSGNNFSESIPNDHHTLQNF